MQPEQQQQSSVRHAKKGTLGALVNLFMSPANPKWSLPPEKEGYALNTKINWGRELVWMALQFGTTPLRQIRPSSVQKFFDGIADRTGKQAVALRALKQLEEWAVVRDYLPHAITTGVKIGTSDGGHIPWTDAQVAIAEQHASPYLGRLVTLGANTGQRISDLIRMGPSDISTHTGYDGIHVVQQKTGRHVWVPILAPLAAAMATWPKRQGPWLRRHDDTPWPRPNIASNAWERERERNPHLTDHRDIPLVIHGLRGHACVRLSRLGLSDHQIGDMIGMSPAMVSRYTRHSKQQDNAVAAVVRLEGARAAKERDAG